MEGLHLKWNELSEVFVQRSVQQKRIVFVSLSRDFFSANERAASNLVACVWQVLF